MLQNAAGCLADIKPWISKPLSWNGFTILTHVTFLTLSLSTNVPLPLLISWLLALYEALSASWLINHIWLSNSCLLDQVGAYFNSSKVWLLEISVVTITDTNRI